MWNIPDPSDDIQAGLNQALVALALVHHSCLLFYVVVYVLDLLFVVVVITGVPRRQSHRRSGLVNLPSVGAVP